MTTKGDAEPGYGCADVVSVPLLAHLRSPNPDNKDVKHALMDC
jgi:hypothetical protein